jgi:hypothetical protein
MKAFKALHLLVLALIVTGFGLLIPKGNLRAAHTGLAADASSASVPLKVDRLDPAANRIIPAGAQL